MRGISWLVQQLFESLDKQGSVKWSMLSPFGEGGCGGCGIITIIISSSSSRSSDNTWEYIPDVIYICT